MSMRPFFGNVVEAIRTSAVTRGLDVRRARAEARAALSRHRTSRRLEGAAMRNALQQHRADVIGRIRDALAPVRPVKRTAAAQGAGIGDSPTSRPAAEHAGVWELWPEAPDLREEVESPYERLESDVRRVIEGHPAGIRAVDIGNELGLDWRRVLAATYTLIEAGAVEQIDHEFYPVGKASRT